MSISRTSRVDSDVGGLGGEDFAVLGQSTKAQIDSLLTQLQRREIQGSFNVSRATAKIMREIVSASKWQNVQALMNTVRSIGLKLIQADPSEIAIGNIVRRVLYIIREENAASMTKPEEEETVSSRPVSLAGSSAMSASLLDLFQAAQKEDYKRASSGTSKAKHLIIESISELINDNMCVYEGVAEKAKDKIHPGEVILTFGRSKTVQMFLEAAIHDGIGHNNFKLIIAEAAPSYDGQKMAADFARKGIKTTLIADSAVFAMIATVDKVIIGAHAVMANGGVIALNGTQLVCLAAKHYKKPVLVATGMYKLSPLYPTDQDSFNELRSPWETLDFKTEASLENVTVASPAYDYVPPELVDMFITNNECHAPSYIYRLLTEYYCPEDHHLDVAVGYA